MYPIYCTYGNSMSIICRTTQKYQQFTHLLQMYIKCLSHWTHSNLHGSKIDNAQIKNENDLPIMCALVKTRDEILSWKYHTTHNITKIFFAFYSLW